MRNNRSATGWWSEFPKYVVSLLKAWFGDAATAENDFLFDSLPRLTGNHSHMTTVSEMADGKVKGYFVMGENPTVGSMHGALHREGPARSSTGWWCATSRSSRRPSSGATAPEIARGEVRTEDIQTEVFFFPAAAHTEKDGSFTNTQRMLQWHHKAIEPPRRLPQRAPLRRITSAGGCRRLYAGSKDPKDRAAAAPHLGLRRGGAAARAGRASGCCWR